MSARDPFPRDAFGALVGRMPAYARLSWRLARDPLVSRARRGVLIAAAAYLVSPIDLVPGIIPVLGQLDDVILILAALRLALGGLDKDQRRVHLEAADRLPYPPLAAPVGSSLRSTPTASSSSRSVGCGPRPP